MKSIASHHSVIAELNQLGNYDYLEAEGLIYLCLEHGLLEWSNPKFLRFLDKMITGLMFRAQHECRQLRGLMYARYVVDHMPVVGVDDGVLLRS
ncbi:hypothetical protein N836_18165 [Leptolyngbya sp. Heron Island J]|uniref:hypothetical protein n=1 Tax=Leptolyngbya sp. Heron Island J TaxID=1385935 RepID=UPI0003B9F789|nr:hypothetical protein [Leptolyngbya sp. Heron Island J]ESA34174.1 hypothetical protein N836_18165 [Leptolyngbya sp. Heron Island J]